VKGGFESETQADAQSMTALIAPSKSQESNKDLTEYKNETAPSMQNIKLQKPHLSKITFRRHKNLLQQKKLAVNSSWQHNGKILEADR